MKILAVIPARTGSKGIPNKNIRLICGHPLVYYAIKNAQKSSLVSDIVVTTDSDDIQIIANQMGVPVHRRKEHLCRDDSTLDAVIEDAIPKDRKWDYIITMQPTSPTLTNQTLDAAIRYAIENNLDTLISVVNEPRLSWRRENGYTIPNYAERLNRQYLPARYCETGAFLIAKASVVTQGTRIGKKVDVYEIPEEEAQDIDSFNDLVCAETILSYRKVAIYVNGNRERGMGHVYRALELADEFYSKPDIYYDYNQTKPEIFGKTTHSLIPVNGLVELFECCKRKKYGLFINDILNTSIDYMIALRSILPEVRIVNFEDEGEGIAQADLVINALYKDIRFPYVYVGERYYISAKPFLFYNPIIIKKEVRSIFICFGGSDPQNYTDRILKIITKGDYQNYQFKIAIGRAKLNVEKLLEYNRYANIEIRYDVHNMPEFMEQCDIAISSRGRTCFELAILGIPTIVLSQNKREESHDFFCAENGFAYIGNNPSNELIETTLKRYMAFSEEDRNKIQKILLRHDLRNGRKHVMELLNSI